MIYAQTTYIFYKCILKFNLKLKCIFINFTLTGVYHET